MKRSLIVGVALMWAFLTACSPQPIKTIGSNKYYAQVQNEGEKYTESSHTRYKYDLKGFNKDGESKKLEFNANHQLKQDAYLQIYYKKDEVITYEEVQHVDMPKKPQKLLTKGKDS